jgi:hypothetical protein
MTPRETSPQPSDSSSADRAPAGSAPGSARPPGASERGASPARSAEPSGGERPAASRNGAPPEPAQAGGGADPAASLEVPLHQRATRFGLSRADLLYAFFATLFCVVLVLTNIIGVKLFRVDVGEGWSWLFGRSSVTLTTGLLSYPITFLVTDLTSEIWGRRKADFMVVMGFLMSGVMLVALEVAKLLPASPLWKNPDPARFGDLEMQTAFELSFSYPGTLLLASMLAYLVAQLLDVRLYHFWWRLTAGKHLWLRNNGSTLISQLVDTIIVNVIFLRLALDLQWAEIAAIIWAVYLFKAALAALDTPLIYLGRAWMRRYLGLPRDEAPERAPLEAP